MPSKQQDWLKELPPLRDVITRHHLDARKGLGQHFLLDLNLTRKIVQQAGLLQDATVFEIGPGPGGLTRAILASDAKALVVIEKDPRCLPIQEELRAFAPERMRIIQGDALDIDLVNLTPAPRVIIANLPYNVATPLLINWLRQAEAFTTMVLMFQSEVVDRIVAEPNTKAYGRLAVLCQYVCEAKRVMSLPARAFTPPPKVDSAVVQLIPKSGLFKQFSFETLEQLTAAAFGQRRKMLRSSLQKFGGEALLTKAGIDPGRRAETLTGEEFISLAALLGT